MIVAITNMLPFLFSGKAILYTKNPFPSQLSGEILSFGSFIQIGQEWPPSFNPSFPKDHLFFFPIPEENIAHTKEINNKDRISKVAHMSCHLRNSNRQDKVFLPFKIWKT
jgi:hypothetical protein